MKALGYTEQHPMEEETGQIPGDHKHIQIFIYENSKAKISNLLKTSKN
jgi:hypothetical protein